MNRLLFVLVLLLVPCRAFSAGSDIAWSASTTPTQSLRVVTGTWVSDSSTGSVSETYPKVIDGMVCLAVTNPGTAAPTDNYDVTVTDEDGVDIFGGSLLNRDTTNSEQELPKIGSSSVPGCRLVHGQLTVNIVNAGNSTEGTIKLFVSR